MIKVGDTVKVIGTTVCGEVEKEYIKIGTICKVIGVQNNEREGLVVCIVPERKLPYNGYGDYWYLEKDVEKGHVEWVAESEETQMKAEVKRTYKADAREELSVDYNGFNYLVIIGKHINGWYIAIPNWNVCTEAGNPIDSFYNREKLSSVLNDVNAGIAIADCITDWWREKYGIKECE